MIPDEVKRKIDEFCEERASNIEEWEGNEMSLLIKTAEFGYSLASQEIERLKVEVERLNSMYLLAMKLNLNNTL